MASSTKEMGPSSRRETLADHFGDWNWKKVLLMGAHYLTSLSHSSNDHRCNTPSEDQSGCRRCL
jgi:hypothetical protein